MYVYCPILKWKTGEINALKRLSIPNEAINPVFQIVEDEVLSPDLFFSQAKSCFQGSFYFDTIQCDDDERSILKEYTEYAIKHGIEANPFLYADDLPDTFLFFKQLGGKFAVNIPVPEDDVPTSEIIEFLESLEPSNIELFLDAGIVCSRHTANLVLFAYKEILQTLQTKLEHFNRITICLSSFPDSIDCDSGGTALYYRYDIKIFKKLLSLCKNLNGHIAYADYGVTKFTETDINPKFLGRILPKVKYTTYDNYVVHKGKRDSHTRQMVRSYIDIAKEIVSAEYFSGQGYSAGDAEIYEKATVKNAKPGNATKWVEINVNHHITLLIEQLSSLGDA